MTLWAERLGVSDLLTRSEAEAQKLSEKGSQFI